MPAIDFPAAPAVNDEYSFEGRTWLWNGTGWEVKPFPSALQAGSAAAPSLYFANDTNTGVFSPGADQMAIATGGVQRLTVDSSGQVAISLGDVDSGAPEPWPTGNNTIYPPTLTLQNYYQQCLVLTDSPANAGNDTRYGSIAGPRYNPTHKAFSGFGIGDSGSQRNVYVGGGGWTCPDANNIYFYTAPTYNETDDQGALRASFTSDGYLRMAASTGGIQFNGDTAGTNALDDYEEGAWTPVFGGGTGSPNLMCKNGSYVKVGRIVTVTFWTASNCGGSGSTFLNITGLPFVAMQNIAPFGETKHQVAALYQTNADNVMTGCTELTFGGIYQNGTQINLASTVTVGSNIQHLFTLTYVTA